MFAWPSISFTWWFGHPTTGEQRVRHQTPRKTTNVRGETVTTMEHRAGGDATFSAPKTVSLTALVGGDARVRDAHEASVDVALDELERYVQARLDATVRRRRPGRGGCEVRARQRAASQRRGRAARRWGTCTSSGPSPKPRCCFSVVPPVAGDSRDA
jgi:hypothetical protein